MPEDGDAVLEAVCDPVSSGKDSITGGKATLLVCNVVFCEGDAVVEAVEVGNERGDDGAVAHGLVCDASVITLSLMPHESMSLLSGSPTPSVLASPLGIEVDGDWGENGTFVSVGDSGALCVCACGDGKAILAGKEVVRL